MAKTPTPAVGQQVHYTDENSGNDIFAKIISVVNENTVDLELDRLDQNGQPEKKTNVRYSDEVAWGTWHYPHTNKK